MIEIIIMIENSTNSKSKINNDFFLFFYTAGIICFSTLSLSLNDPGFGN